LASGDVGEGGKPARRKLGKLALAGGAVLVSAVLATLLASTSLGQLLELKTYDLRFVLRGKATRAAGANPQIVLVTVDDATEVAIAEPRVFWQPYYAALLRALAAGGARLIGMDISFALSVEKWAPDNDRALAAAFAETGAAIPIVLAYDNLQPMPQSLPLYMLASAQNAIGFANLTLDRDNFIRRQELASKGPDGWESFAARLAALSRNVEKGTLDAPRHVYRLGSTEVPLDRSGYLLVNYRGPEGSFPTVSMGSVLEAASKQDTGDLKRWFDGKIVLIGTLDPLDRKATPFYLSGKGQALTPGVEVQASILDTLLSERFLREVPRWGTLVLILSAATLAALAVLRVRFPLAPVILVAAVVAYFGASVVWLGRGWVLPVVGPLVSVVFAGFASYGADALTEGRRRRLLQEMFGRYVSKEVAEELLASGEIPLGGALRTVTVMFTDIRNYTSYSQHRDPQQIVAELNEYFDYMTAEIKAHGGMVNKFIGDGIMALFGAPVAHPDDARRAIACGLHMIRRNDEYNQGRARKGLDPLVIGIGVHTGEAVVGTIGAREKMEYTAIGNTVNVSARVEGENKKYNSRMLVTEDTYKLVREEAEGELAGYAELKGIDEPVPLYKIVKLKGGGSCSLGS
jgi:adenylate cyclase